jgi:hypothetical protein
MALNTPITKLDAAQIAPRVFQVADDSIRVTVGAGSDFAISLDAAEDSVSTQAVSVYDEADVDDTTPIGILIEASAVGMSQVQLFCKTTTTIVDPRLLTVQVSPLDTGDFWVASGLTLTPNTTQDATSATSIASFVAQRVRVICTQAITSGAFTIVLAQRG